MAQLTVRNIDDELVRKLKIRAARRNRSAEAEHRAILEQALAGDEESFLRAADELRRLSRPQTTDSTDLIREERDRRAGLRE